MKEENEMLPDPQSRMHSMFEWLALFFEYLWRRKFLIIIIVLIGGVGGAMYNYYKDAKYTAKLTFALDEEGVNSYANIAEQFGISLESNAGGAFKGENLLELFKSRYIIEKTLLAEGELKSKNDLLINFLLDIEYPKKFSNAGFAVGKPTSLYQDSIINVVHESIVKDMLDVSRIDKRLIYVNVSVSSKNPAFSKLLVEKLLDNVIQYYVETKTKKAKKNVDVMHRELDSVKGLMTGAIYQSARGTDLNVNPLKQIVRAPIQKSTAEAQVYVIAYGEIMKNLELAKLNLLKETPLVQVIDRPVLPLKKEKKGRLSGLITWGFITFLFVLCFFYIRFLFNRRKILKVG
jgi:uncharacterized protein involved in exopolysaccharide biosynthesis